MWKWATGPTASEVFCTLTKFRQMGPRQASVSQLHIYAYCFLSQWSNQRCQAMNSVENMALLKVKYKRIECDAEHAD